MLCPQLEPQESQGGSADFVRRHLAGLWRYLRVLGCNRQLAEDLAQDAFLVALRRNFQPEGDAQAASFLRRTARYLFLNHSRKHRAERGWVDAVDAVADRMGTMGSDNMRLQALEDCVSRLTGRSARAVQLHYRDGWDHRQMSTEFGISVHGVRTMLRRLRASLRECVRRQLGEGEEDE